MSTIIQEYVEGSYSFFTKAIREIEGQQLPSALNSIAENIYQRYFNGECTQTDSQPVEYHSNDNISGAIEFYRRNNGIYPIQNKMLQMRQILMDEIIHYMIQNKISGIEPFMPYAGPVLTGFVVNMDQFQDSQFYQNHVIESYQKTHLKK